MRMEGGGILIRRAGRTDESTPNVRCQPCLLNCFTGCRFHSGRAEWCFRGGKSCKTLSQSIMEQWQFCIVNARRKPLQHGLSFLNPWSAHEALLSCDRGVSFWNRKWCRVEVLDWVTQQTVMFEILLTRAESKQTLANLSELAKYGEQWRAFYGLLLTKAAWRCITMDLTPWHIPAVKSPG